MKKIMNELYYMIDNWAGQQYENDERTRSLEAQKFALEKELALRIGEGGEEMLETLAGLNLALSDIHDKALFRATLCFVTELREPAVN